MSNPPIRILHIVGGMGTGGAETLIMNWYRSIDRTKVQFDFLVHHKEKMFYDDEIESLGGRIYRFSLSNDHNIFRYRKELYKFFASHPEYKIIHGHHSTYGVLYLSVARKCGIPFRISHSHIASYSKTLKGISFYLLSRFYKKYANIYFACSLAAGHYMYGEDKDFKVINNGINTTLFGFSKEKRGEIRTKLNIPDNVLTLAHVGRFHDQKNHHFLIDVFSQVCKLIPNSRLLLLGVGPLLSDIREKVKALGLDKNVLFLEQRPNVQDYLSASDLFVFPSLYEGLPLTLVEAQASGLPIVCSDTITEETKLTDNYYILSLEQSSKEWADKIVEVSKKTIARDDAHFIVRRKGYDCQDIANQLICFYSNLLNNYKNEK